MTAERNAFTAICLLASREQWCWNINCTTCGHMYFRYGFFEIGAGRHPDRDGWLTRKEFHQQLSTLGDLRTVTAAIRRSERLHQVASDASLSEIAGGCRFPDFLGYLGLLLHYTSELEHRNRRLTPVWSRQLLELVDENAPPAQMLRQRQNDLSARLSWKDLDGLEHNVRRKVLYE